MVGSMPCFEGLRTRSPAMLLFFIAVSASLACLLGASSARADQRDPRLDRLFAQLRDAKSELEAAAVSDQIWAIWNSAADPSLDALMRQGSAALEQGELLRAVELFSLIIDRDRDFAEAWNKRATAYYVMRDYESSIRDVVQLLELEPRHFKALSGMGLIYSELRADGPALRWFERALEVHPYLDGVPQRVRALRVKLRQGET